MRTYIAESVIFLETTQCGPSTDWLKKCSSENPMSDLNANEIFRHRTAIGRSHFSRPIRLLLEAGLLSSEHSLFDYGCGRGQDLRRLQRLGIEAHGWDPAHSPLTPKRVADAVNIGYVVNVIENPVERQDALREAWSFAKRVLVVAARLDIERKRVRGSVHADGYVTSRDTFQKLFSQHELKDWVSETTGSPAIPAAPGVVFVFRDESLRQSYLASRYQRRRAAPRVRQADRLFDEHRQTFEPLLRFLTQRGRLPVSHELENAEELHRRVGSIRRAHAVLRRVAGSDAWEAVRNERVNELLVFLALQKFTGRPKFSNLPETLQLDIRAFFSSYKTACERADQLLFESGDTARRDAAMREAPVGKLTGNALYVHIDALAELPAILRIYEGCARQYVGDIEGADVAKLNRTKPQISYLMYPEFRSNPHPPTKASLVVPLGSPHIRYRDYSDSPNPSLLHRKEEMLAADDPDRDKFLRLTRQEERWGLYEHPEDIGTLSGWQSVLRAKGLTHRGHRLLRVK